jgi:hypothetical protein
MIRAERDLPGTEEERGKVCRRGVGWRKQPNNVCTFA